MTDRILVICKASKNRSSTFFAYFTHFANLDAWNDVLAEAAGIDLNEIAHLRDIGKTKASHKILKVLEQEFCGLEPVC